MKHYVRTAHTNVDGDHVPRSHQQTIELGKSRLDKGVEEISLRLVRKSVHRFGLRIFFDEFETDSLLLVERVAVDEVARSLPGLLRYKFVEIYCLGKN